MLRLKTANIFEIPDPNKFISSLELNRKIGDIIVSEFKETVLKIS